LFSFFVFSASVLWAGPDLGVLSFCFLWIQRDPRRMPAPHFAKPKNMQTSFPPGPFPTFGLFATLVGAAYSFSRIFCHFSQRCLCGSPNAPLPDRRVAGHSSSSIFLFCRPHRSTFPPFFVVFRMSILKLLFQGQSFVQPSPFALSSFLYYQFFSGCVVRSCNVVGPGSAPPPPTFGIIFHSCWE